MIGIYKITSPTGRIYIGQTVESHKRFGMYRRGHCKEQPRIYNSLIKHGYHNHKIEIIHECLESELNELEIYYIKFYNSVGDIGMNCHSGGSHGRHSEETKRKMSISTKLMSQEVRDKISKAGKGKKKPIGFGEKISKAQKGKNRPKGVGENISKGKTGKTHKGTPCSDDKKAKISLANKGRKHTNAKRIPITDEQRIKYSNLLKGNKYWVGRKHKPESIEKQKIVAKNREVKFKPPALILNIETGIFYEGYKELGATLNRTKLSIYAEINRRKTYTQFKVV